MPIFHEQLLGTLHGSKARQVQGEMGVMRCDWCYFVILTEGGLFVEEIPFDDHIWKDTMLPNFTTFYRDKLVPEILCRKIQQDV